MQINIFLKDKEVGCEEDSTQTLISSYSSVDKRLCNRSN